MAYQTTKHVQMQFPAWLHFGPPATHAGTPDMSIAGVLAVIPAKAGIHRFSPATHAGTPDTSIAGVLAVIPAKAGIHTALTGHECVRMRSGRR